MLVGSSGGKYRVGDETCLFQTVTLSQIFYYTLFYLSEYNILIKNKTPIAPAYTLLVYREQQRFNSSSCAPFLLYSSVFFIQTSKVHLYSWLKKKEKKLTQDNKSFGIEAGFLRLRFSLYNTEHYILWWRLSESKIRFLSNKLWNTRHRSFTCVELFNFFFLFIIRFCLWQKN